MKKPEYDSILNPIGFQFIEETPNGDMLYAHKRAPIHLRAYFSGGKDRCRISYIVESPDFSEIVTKTNLDSYLIIRALRGMKTTLEKLGLDNDQ